MEHMDGTIHRNEEPEEQNGRRVGQKHGQQGNVDVDRTHDLCLPKERASACAEALSKRQETDQSASSAASNCASVVGENVIGTFMPSAMVTVVNDEE